LIKAVLFDFDGVLVDSAEINFEVKRRLFLPFGLELSEREFREIWVSPTSGKKAGNKYFVKLHGLNADVQELREKQKPIFVALFREKAELMPGALSFIKALKERKIPVAIVSSNFRYNIDVVLQKFGLQRCFDAIISTEDCSKPKPHPEPYLKAIQKLGVKPENVLAFEDSGNGVESAKSAGCKCIAMPNHFTLNEDFSKADLVVKSLTEIDFTILKKL
jgi:HAD superfamily hydrolase (TIGR01509 family)